MELYNGTVVVRLGDVHIRVTSVQSQNEFRHAANTSPPATYLRMGVEICNVWPKHCPILLILTI